jgi:hypothetical protein
LPVKDLRGSLKIDKIDKVSNVDLSKAPMTPFGTLETVIYLKF